MKKIKSTSYLIYNQIQIRCQESPEEAIALLKKEVQGTSPYFEGNISGNTFNINRKTASSRALPFIVPIKGTVSKQHQETEIFITMRLNLWGVILLLLAEFYVKYILRDHGMSISFTWILYLAIYNLEVYRIKEKLKKIYF